MFTGRPLTVTREDATLHAWCHGAEGSPVVAFVHGGFMDRRMFDPQIGPLVEDGYAVLTWDLHGHGESSRRGTQRPSVADMAADLFTVLDEVDQSEPVILVGQSLGGMVVQHAALTIPSRVSGLVTIGAPCINPADRKLRRRASLLWQVSGFITGLLPSSAVRAQLSKGTAATPEAQRYVQSVVQRVTKDDFRWLVHASREAGRGLRGQRVAVPQLITLGEHDDSGAGRLTALTASHWVSRDPSARYEVIPGAGHLAHQDQPELFNRLLLDFLASIA